MQDLEARDLVPELCPRQGRVLGLVHHPAEAAAWREIAHLNIASRLADDVAERTLGEPARQVQQDERILVVEALPRDGATR